MPEWVEIVVLAFASMFWPTLITIVVLALRVPHPVKILFWFVAGGLLTTISIGLVLVFALQDSSFISGSEPPGDPVLNIVLGSLAVAVALVVRRRGAAHSTTTESVSTEHDESGLAARAVRRGAPIAFLAGVVLNIVPGAFPFVALKDIAQLDASDATKVVAVVVFYVIMFAFAEVPIVSFLIAPEWTTAKVDAFNAWLRRNANKVAVGVLAVVGIYLIVRGILQAVR